MTPRVLALLANAFRPEYRDSYYLYAGWELLDRALNAPTLDVTLREGANDVRRSFLAEFPNLIKAGDLIAVELDRSFVRCPPTHKRIQEDKDRRPFLQGTPGDMEDEYPHRVIVSPFWLMDFVVTNAQFERMAPRHRRTIHNKTDESPVTNVTWFEARIFAVWTGADLPTEAQWEYAARAGSHSKYYRIADPQHPDGYRDLSSSDEWSHLFEQPGQVTTLRGRLLPNWWGLYAMLGNVEQWCGDWISREYYRELSPLTIPDPTGPVNGFHRVTRGNCFFDNSDNCRLARRGAHNPCERSDYVGFRLARSRT